MSDRSKFQLLLVILVIVSGFGSYAIATETSQPPSCDTPDGKIICP